MPDSADDLYVACLLVERSSVESSESSSDAPKEQPEQGKKDISESVMVIQYNTNTCIILKCPHNIYSGCALLPFIFGETQTYSLNR